MTDYLKRPAEVFDLILQFARSTSALPVDPLASTSFTQYDAERASFNTRVTEYFQRRKERLDALLEKMDGIRSGTENGPSLWRGPLDSLASDRESTLGAILKGISGTPSKQATELHWKLYEEERKFIEGLRDVPVAERWERIGKLRIQLMDTVKNLDIRWKDLLDKLKSVDEMQSRLSSDVLTLISDAKKDLGRKDVDTAGELLTAVDRLQRAATQAANKDGLEQARSLANEAFANIDQALAYFVDATRIWRFFSSTLIQNAKLLEAAQRAEMDLHRIFAGIRRETIEYLRSPPKDQAEYLIKESQSLLGDLGSKMPTQPMGADLTDLGEELVKRANKTVETIAEFTKVLDGHKGRFFDSLSSDTFDVLMRRSEWDTRRDRIEQQRMPETIKFLLGRAKNFCEVDIAKPCEALIKALADRNVPEQASKRDEVLDGIRQRWERTQREIDSATRDAVRAIEDAKLLFDSPDVPDLHLRKAVERNLRSGTS
jgi:hypothetical protein